MVVARDVRDVLDSQLLRRSAYALFVADKTTWTSGPSARQLRTAFRWITAISPENAFGIEKMRDHVRASRNECTSPSTTTSSANPAAVQLCRRRRAAPA